jgi:very-short-patch-repair endonuclease
MTALSRTMRQRGTDAEAALWRRLRRQQLGAKFRRQQPIGPYIVDFVSFNPKVIIEVDGGSHNTRAVAKRDEDRMSSLEAQGYRVLRFWNNDVLNNADGVMETIREALR